MDSIPAPFTVEIDGKPIAKIGESDDDRSQAQLGEEGAVFNLQNGRLQSGDWVLGRNVSEDRSFRPKKLLWFKANADNEQTVQSVKAKKEGDNYELEFPSSKLIIEDGKVFADLSGDSQSAVKVILQQG